MFTEIFIIIAVIVILAIIINGVEDYSRDREAMSFREAMDLAELPVVTFYQGKEKFNFLLDTGSMHSHISKEAAERIKGEPDEVEVNVNGVGGSTSVVDKAIKVSLEYKNNSYNAILLAGNHLDETFKVIKDTTGVTVHGVIGSNFLNENKYVLDFEGLIAYSKA